MLTDDKRTDDGRTGEWWTDENWTGDGPSDDNMADGHAEDASCTDLMIEQERGAELGQTIRAILSPIMESMAKFMKINSEALERLASAQKVQSDRMEALEKQIRLNTLVTPTQVRYFNDSIRKRARELLAKKELDGDALAVKSLSGKIRKSVVTRYGIAALHEIPRHEYSVVMMQIDTWNDMLMLRDVMKEATHRK